MSPRFKPGGFGEYILDGVVTTVHTKKCVHCQTMVEFPSMRKIHEHMDVCRLCMDFICLPCTARPCVHHLKKIEAAEKAAYARAQLAKALGT